MQAKHRPPATTQVPKAWVWHYRHLMQLREKLLNEHLPGKLAGVAEPIEPHSMDMADSATDEFDHDMTNCILSHEQDALYEVDAAIQRILEGGYGICEETGEAIPAARLRAVPWTRYTKAVEERLEKEGLISRTRLSTVSSIRRRPDSGGLLQMEEPTKEDTLTPEELRHERQAEIRAIESAEESDDHFHAQHYKS